MTAAEQQALKEKIAVLEAEREKERQADLEAKAAAVRRVWSRAEWAATLTLPASAHRDGCPAERIEAFDNSAGGRTTRCIDCGEQAIHYPDHRILEG